MSPLRVFVAEDLRRVGRRVTNCNAHGRPLCTKLRLAKGIEMNRKWLRIALPALCLALAQCTASTTTSSGPPTAFATARINAVNGTGDNTFGPNKTIVVT